MYENWWINLHHKTHPNMPHRDLYLPHLARVFPKLKKAVTEKQKCEKIYDTLLSYAPDAEDQKIIREIRNDERRHQKMFRGMYARLTGGELPVRHSNKGDQPENYVAGLTHALINETDIAKYRQIYFLMPDQAFQQLAFEILTDDSQHGLRLLYLYSKNRNQG